MPETIFHRLPGRAIGNGNFHVILACNHPSRGELHSPEQLPAVNHAGEPFNQGAHDRRLSPVVGDAFVHRSVGFVSSPQPKYVTVRVVLFWIVFK
jgi:hypothetical protein